MATARAPRLAFVIVGLLFALLILVPASAARLTDWLWFREIGFEGVFLTRILAWWQLFLGAGVLVFAVLYGNARFALRGIEKPEDSLVRLAEGGIRTRDRLLQMLAHKLSFPVSLVLAVMTALSVAAGWRTLVQFIHRTSFGVTDPIFGRDIGYYVFTLPMLQGVLDLLGSALFLSFVFIALPIYVSRGDLQMRDNRLAVDLPPVDHLVGLGAAWLLLRAVRVWFVGIPSLLFGVHGPLQGASWTDLHVRLPGLRVLAVALVISAAYLIVAARRGRVVRAAAIVAVGNIGLTLLLEGLVPAFVQRTIVQPNELDREREQIVHHIGATRRAWGLEDVERRELEAEVQLTAADIARNRETIDNIRLWDREPLLQTLSQIQSIRTYYDFISVDDDRYVVDGQLRHVQLSPRELDVASLPTRTFVNEHLTFTHGMGLTLGATNAVTPEGLPILWVQNLPPTSSVGPTVTRPQIYFGELPTSFVLVPSKQREFDYPAAEGDEAVYSTYTGTAGVPIDALWRRVLFGLRFGSANILLSPNLTDESRILFHQNVRERAQLALPFLDFDGDPYLVVSDSGHLKWMLDGYTETDQYPYSASMANGVNYRRNSVKVVIDAYHGTVEAYLADANDPLVQTWAKVYPGLLRDLATMPADLRAHVRYPEDLFRAQTALYATFHMTDPETFYHREDQWQTPASEAPARTTRTAEQRNAYARHIVMKLPGEQGVEYLMMRPFTPRQKDNLAAWMVVRNDGPHYGKFIVYQFPRQSLVFGPTQIANRIRQDTEVSRQISLWDAGGSEVMRGELLVIPIEASLLYVQPLYLRAQGGRIPELKRVIVAHEGRVVMDETLDAGLRTLFGDGTGTARGAARSTTVASREASPAPTTSTEAQREALVREASERYDRARAAQRADDWATYGTEMQRLGETLRRLRELRAP